MGHQGIFAVYVLLVQLVIHKALNTYIICWQKTYGTPKDVSVICAFDTIIGNPHSAKCITFVNVSILQTQSTCISTTIQISRSEKEQYQLQYLANTLLSEILLLGLIYNNNSYLPPDGENDIKLMSPIITCSFHDIYMRLLLC